MVGTCMLRNFTVLGSFMLPCMQPNILKLVDNVDISSVKLSFHLTFLNFKRTR